MVVTGDTRFKLGVRCFALLLVICCSMVLANSGSSVNLAYKCLPALRRTPEKPPVIFLHGLIDSKETWEGIYEVIPYWTNRRVCIYDARNHGDSSWNDTFTLDVLAEDLSDFMRDRGIKRASLVGHSMGGLTVMKFAFKSPDKVESAFVEDISPKYIRQENADALRNVVTVLQYSLSAIPDHAGEQTALKAVLDYFAKMTTYILPAEIFKRFPLRRVDGVWQWKMNCEVLIKALGDSDSFIGNMDGLYDGRSFFIYGEQSEFRVFEDKELILKRFPKAEFYGVKGANHLVHLHRAIYVIKLVQFLNSLDNSEE